MKQTLWKGLLFLTGQVKTWTGLPGYCSFDFGSQTLLLDQSLTATPDFPPLQLYFGSEVTPPQPTDSRTAQLRWAGDFHWQILTGGQWPAEALQFVHAYLPYCFCSWIARREQRAISIAHFAQTLDGKIATETGYSRWIGNEENLKHAHRMRALCDAILIGRSTLDQDQPRLTVRHVSGPNPRRIVLGSRLADYSCLLDAALESVMVIGTEKRGAENLIEYCSLPCENDRLRGLPILQYLFQKGCQSVYIEGGTQTTSNFIKDRAVDILQLHLSPQIFGSGRPAFILPTIDKVEDAVQFTNFHYQTVGDTLMFVGQLPCDGSD
ncbi:MAG: RibD family protein [Bacteroidota bacterium]